MRVRFPKAPYLLIGGTILLGLLIINLQSNIIYGHLRGGCLCNGSDSDTIKYNLTMYNVKNFSLSKDDVIVFLHMQKTGGTSFDRFLVENLLNSSALCTPKEKTKYSAYNCKNNHNRSWLYTRATASWRCGVHADWSQLHKCIAGYYNDLEETRYRRFLYMTVVRDPFSRFISEWLHVSRGAEWPEDKLGCIEQIRKIRNATLCHPLQTDWKNVSLTDFIDCPYNPAANRQTWMLADLEAVGCNKLTTLNEIKLKSALLESAKRNLEKMAHFTLLERRVDTYITLKQAFGLNYKKEHINPDRKDKAEVNSDKITEAHESRIRMLNTMDTELYNYAKELYNKRYTI